MLQEGFVIQFEKKTTYNLLNFDCIRRWFKECFKKTSHSPLFRKSYPQHHAHKHPCSIFFSKPNTKDSLAVRSSPFCIEGYAASCPGAIEFPLWARPDIMEGIKEKGLERNEKTLFVKKSGAETPKKTHNTKWKSEYWLPDSNEVSFGADARSSFESGGKILFLNVIWWKCVRNLRSIRKISEKYRYVSWLLWTPIDGSAKRTVR